MGLKNQNSREKLWNFFKFENFFLILGKTVSTVSDVDVKWNTPMEIFSSKYVLVWVREQNTAFIMDF